MVILFIDTSRDPSSRNNFTTFWPSCEAMVVQHKKIDVQVEKRDLYLVTMPMTRMVPVECSCSYSLRADRRLEVDKDCEEGLTRKYQVPPKSRQIIEGGLASRICWGDEHVAPLLLRGRKSYCILPTPYVWMSIIGHCVVKGLERHNGNCRDSNIGFDILQDGTISDERGILCLYLVTWTFERCPRIRYCVILVEGMMRGLKVRFSGRIPAAYIPFSVSKTSQWHPFHTQYDA